MSNPLKLVAFSEEQPARLLAHFLVNNGIRAEYRRVDADFEHGVFYFDHHDETAAKVIAEEFVLNPGHEQYQSAAWQSGESVTLSADKSFSMAKVMGNLAQAPFSACILVFCVVVYLLATIGITAPYLLLKIQPIDTLVETHQWWRVLGPALLHGSVLHIAFNLLWWWTLGKQIENTFGSSSLLLLFVFSAGVSNLAQLFVSGPNFVGLSGVVYALVGCVWWLGWLKPEWEIHLPKPFVVFMLIWLVVGYVDILPIHMANTAHTMGLLSGCLFACFLVARARGTGTQ